ncbi:MAG TPA: peptidase MA family metallohydrolase [Bacillota bacterium]
MFSKSVIHIQIRHVLQAMAILLPLAVLSYGLATHFEVVRSVVYNQLRERGKAVAVARSSGFEILESDHFVLRYELADQDVAPMVLKTAESFYAPVTRDLAYTPPGKVTLILYPTRDDLKNSFGWPSLDDAMGVYWTGVIRVLSPKAWTGTTNPNQMERSFRKNGPIAHELTHYVLDYKTSGNYPRWFTEGLAQYEEHRLTGFIWIEPESSLDQSLYTLNDLQNRFDSLDNQALAYRESFTMISFIAEKYGPEALQGLITDLSKGASLDQALKSHSGLAGTDFEKAWLTWVYDQPDRWNQ